MADIDIKKEREGTERLQQAWWRLTEEWPVKDGLTSAGVMEQYNKWDLYDEDMAILGYQIAAALASSLSDMNLPEDALILEIACGTGLLGEKMKKAGYNHVHGMDGSPLLLKKAEEKNVYEKYMCCLLGGDTKLKAENGSYDAVISAGGLAPGHLTIEAIKDLFRVIKYGGYFAHATRDSHLSEVSLPGYHEFINKCLMDGSLVTIKDEVFGNVYDNVCGPPIGETIPGRIQIFKKLAN